MMRSLRWLVLGILLSASGCVYYNTFFHAEQAYKEAETQRKRANQDVASGAAAQKYGEAVKKASKVLQRYPKSKYADDALLMIGKSFYYTGQYIRAKEKFVELSTVFRESPLIPEARFYLGMSEYYLENPEKSREILKDIAESGKRAEFRDLASFMLARIPYEEADYADALPALQSYREKYPNSQHTVRADSMIASSFWELEQYDSARTEFAYLYKQTDDENLQYHALYRKAECAYRTEDYSTGLEEFRDLANEDKYYDHVGMLRYQVAMGLRALDSIPQAVEIFRKLPEDFAKSEEAARSLYALGEIYEERGDSLKVAQRFYQEITKTWTRDKDLAAAAVERASEIGRLLSLQQSITGEDSARVAATHFLLGELYLRQLDQPDSALQQFRLVVDEFPESEYATRALLNIADLLATREDSSTAVKVWHTLVRRYPTGEAAMWARSKIGLPLPEDITKSDILLLHGAEKQLLEYDNPDSALKLYDLLLTDYPESRYRAKAMYARAWLMDQHFAQDDSAVVFAYQQVVDSFPQSPYAKDAKQKLNPPGREARTITAQLTDTLTRDTTYIDTAAEKVTIQQLSDTTVAAPQPLVKGEFEYPPPIVGFTWRDNIKLTFLIHINDQGEVEDDLQLVGKSGHDEIDFLAIEAVKRTRFDPAKLDPYLTLIRQWYKYDLIIPPPGTQQNDQFDNYEDPFGDQNQ